MVIYSTGKPYIKFRNRSYYEEDLEEIAHILDDLEKSLDNKERSLCVLHGQVASLEAKTEEQKQKIEELVVANKRLKENIENMKLFSKINEELTAPLRADKTFAKECLVKMKALNRRKSFYADGDGVERSENHFIVPKSEVETIDTDEFIFELRQMLKED